METIFKRSSNIKYSNRHEEITQWCQECITFSEIEIRMGLTSPNNSLRRYIQKHNIPMPNYLGRKAAHFYRKSRKLVTLDDLKLGNLLSPGSVKNLLLKEGLKIAI